jgi:hypothetical protein
MFVLSIDVGLIHLGLSFADVNDDGTLLEIFWVDLIDITTYTHRKSGKISRESQECPLYHTRTISDWVDHFIHENKPFFEEADVILVERQPPNGLTAVEQLIFSKFRAKTHLISPRNVHSYFNLTSFDYDQRKVYSEKIASRHIPDYLADQMTMYDRFHDIADSVCILIYWCNKRKKAHDIDERRRRHFGIFHEDGLTTFEKLERFRY